MASCLIRLHFAALTYCSIGKVVQSQLKHVDEAVRYVSTVHDAVGPKYSARFATRARTILNGAHSLGTIYQAIVYTCD